MTLVAIFKNAWRCMLYFFRVDFITFDIPNHCPSKKIHVQTRQ